MMKSQPSTYSKKQQIKEEQDDIASSNNTTSNNYGMPAPTNENTTIRLTQIDEMKLFFATATQQWESNKNLKRFNLPGCNGESVSCVLWNDLFFITGTDIVRSLTFRFHAFGRPVANAKKFEEGIFSDLRNLKPGHDARLEEPKSELLDMLYKNNCIRTQKKQKVFFWFSVPHDRLFLDALERDLKREKMGMEPTTTAMAEPAISLSLDSTQELFDQLRKSMSQSAAATAQAMEKDLVFSSSPSSPQPNSSLSLSHVSAISPMSTTNSTTDKIATHTPWSASQSRLERAASQAKRSRVNSVPANLGQQQHFQLMQQQQQQQKHHRLSHGSYFSGGSTKSNSYKMRSSAPNSTRSSNVTPRHHSHHHRTNSSSASSLLSIKIEENMFDDNCSVTTCSTNKSLPTTKFDTNSQQQQQQQQQHYLDPISHGVDQLEITTSLSNHSIRSTSTTIPPSKSMDSNAMKKTKAIFGNLPLFDGSPTYKQRRRRAVSVSTNHSSGLNNVTPPTSTSSTRSGRHANCHLRHSPTTPTHRHHSISHRQSTSASSLVTPPHSSSSTGSSTNHLINSHSSRLAMAAVKAGFAPNQIIPSPSPPVQPSQMTTMQMLQMSSSSTTPQQHYASNSYTSKYPQTTFSDFLCPMPGCNRIFRVQEHLDRHINNTHSLLCNFCGKLYHQQELLDQHYRLEHEYKIQPHPMSVLHNSDDHNNHDDDGSSPPRYSSAFGGATSSALYNNRNHVFNTGSGSDSHGGNNGFYSSRSTSGWSTSAVNTSPPLPPHPAALSSTTTTLFNNNNQTATTGSSTVSYHSGSSRCSTLSPMLDLDFDMPDISPPQPTNLNSTSSSKSSSDASSIVLPTEQQQATMNHVYYSSSGTVDSLWPPPLPPPLPHMTTTTGEGSFMEDEYTTCSTTSSASSPCSTLPLQYSSTTTSYSYSGGQYPYHHQQQQQQQQGNDSMTLLSPFKPTSFQQQGHFLQHHQQTQMMPTVGEEYSTTHYNEDVSMFSSNINNINESTLYAPYVDHHQQQQHYTPSFLTSPDNMNIVFGA